MKVVSILTRDKKGNKNISQNVTSIQLPPEDIEGKQVNVNRKHFAYIVYLVLTFRQKQKSLEY